MGRYVEKSGKNVNDAIAAALEELKLTIDDVHVDVINEGKTGLFGLLSGKPAKVRVSELDEDERVPQPGFSGSAVVTDGRRIGGNKGGLFGSRGGAGIGSGAGAGAGVGTGTGAAGVGSNLDAASNEEMGEETSIETGTEFGEEPGEDARRETSRFTGREPGGATSKKTSREAGRDSGRDSGNQPGNEPEDDLGGEINTNSKQFGKKQSANRFARDTNARHKTGASEDKYSQEDNTGRQVDYEYDKNRAMEYLSEIFNGIHVIVSMNAEPADDEILINIESEDSGILIGHRGETLDAIQYLVNLYINKGRNSFIRISVDVERYKEKRQAALVRLAGQMADKVVRLRRNFTMDAMNSYERRIIHSVLQNHPRVETYSIGEEPNRKIVVTLKNRGGYSPR